MASTTGCDSGATWSLLVIGVSLAMSASWNEGSLRAECSGILGGSGRYGTADRAGVDRRIGTGRAAGSFALAIESGTVGGATIARRGGVTYGRGFFDLQIEFAEAVSALSGIPLARAV